ncbi:MAG: 4'-phosphopantetheinyl transferase family protein [Gammaproteobacteria bacterium]
MPVTSPIANPALTLKLWHHKPISTPADQQQYWRLLHTSEQMRASSIKNESKQATYIAAHALLRTILSQTVKQPHDQLIINQTQHGKPYLADFPEIAFNLSHTDDMIVIAVGHRCRLGVDIETCKPRPNLPSLVEKCFAEVEALWWHALPDAEKIREFYRFWTRKEAFVKATGRGIALGLDRCIVNPENPSVWLSVPENYGPASSWHVRDIDLGRHVCLALVADRVIADVELHAC